MEEKITRRQLLVLCFGGMLSPLTRLIPGEMAQAAGKAAWLCPLAALPVVLLVVWLLEVSLRRLPNGGMGTMLQAGYGKALGRVLCVANGIWLFMELVVCLRMYAERFLGSSYRDASGFLLILTLVLLALWESRKSLPATARLAQLSFYPLVAAVAAVLLLSVEEIQAANLLPVWYDDLPEIGYGGAFVVQAFALWFAGYNLYGRVERREKAGNALGWPAALLICLTLVELAIIGVFGSELAQRIQAPFMVLAKEIRLGKTIERLEAVVIAVWTLSDLLLVVLEHLPGVGGCRGAGLRKGVGGSRAGGGAVRKSAVRNAGGDGAGLCAGYPAAHSAGAGLRRAGAGMFAVPKKIEKKRKKGLTS